MKYLFLLLLAVCGSYASITAENDKISPFNIFEEIIRDEIEKIYENVTRTFKVIEAGIPLIPKPFTLSLENIGTLQITKASLRGLHKFALVVNKVSANISNGGFDTDVELNAGWTDKPFNIYMEHTLKIFPERSDLQWLAGSGLINVTMKDFSIDLKAQLRAMVLNESAGVLNVGPETKAHKLETGLYDLTTFFNDVILPDKENVIGGHVSHLFGKLIEAIVSGTINYSMDELIESYIDVIDAEDVIMSLLIALVRPMINL